MGSFHRYYLRQRFFPDAFSICINPFYFCRKALLKNIQPLAAKLTGDLLDFGCGAKPYKTIFTAVDSYVGVDIENEGHNHENEDVDVYYDGNTLPFDNNRFDVVFTSEVLEHVPDIDASLDELHRVLKADGKLLITVPFVWPEHELPFDFRRFTVNGMEKLLNDHGFSIKHIQKSGSYMETLYQMRMMYLHDLLYTKHKYLNLLINGVFIAPLCLTGIFFSAVFPQKNSLYLNSVIVAQKCIFAATNTK